MLRETENVYKLFFEINWYFGIPVFEITKDSCRCRNSPNYYKTKDSYTRRMHSINVLKSFFSTTFLS